MFFFIRKIGTKINAQRQRKKGYSVSFDLIVEKL